MEFLDSAVSLLQTGSEILKFMLQVISQHAVPCIESGTGTAAQSTSYAAILPLLKSALLFLAGIALVFGVTLALIAKYFNTKTDPKVDQVDELLAHAHCGACGFAGCHQYAEAVVNKPEVSPSLCTPAGKAAAAKIAALVGKEVGEQEPRVAFVACRGDSEMSKKKFEHRGVADCVAASTIAGGDKECPYGCLGYGSCEAACPFEAIKVNSNGLAEVDEKKCVACGICVKACPRKIISIVKISKKPIVKCYSNDKGPAVKRICKVGCIGCGLCVKNCPSQAIEMVKNLARIDQSKCTDCGLCIEKCPSKAIVRIS